MFSIFLWCLGAVWLLISLKSILAVRAVPHLPSTRAVQARVSVIVAVRDEAARIERTVLNLLAQQGVDLEVIAVDDRSTDGTSDILDRLVSTDSRLQVVHIRALPTGWLGKCHAMHLGAQRATGEWLVFTDGDIWVEASVVARAVAAARREQVDHVCLLPRIGNPGEGSPLDHAGLLVFALAFAHAMADANRDRPWRFVGVGAFNMVAANAYRAIGGHEPLRLEIIDDMKLGLLLRRAGKRTRAYDASGEVECDWPIQLRALIKGLEKNSFAGALFSIPLLLLLTALMVGAWLPPLFGPFTGTPAGWASCAALFSLFTPAAMLARRNHWPAWTSALVPIVGCPLLVVTLWHSAFTTLRQGGVLWRDTFYPLEELRKGVVK